MAATTLSIVQQPFDVEMGCSAAGGGKCGEPEVSDAYTAVCSICEDENTEGAGPLLLGCCGKHMCMACGEAWVAQCAMNAARKLSLQAAGSPGRGGGGGGRAGAHALGQDSEGERDEEQQAMVAAKLTLDLPSCPFCRADLADDALAALGWDPEGARAAARAAHEDRALERARLVRQRCIATSLLAAAGVLAFTGVPIMSMLCSVSRDMCAM